MVRHAETLLLATFVLGLGVSISLAQTALGLLALCWLLRLREPGRWRSLRFPLLAPFLALTALTLVAALASSRPTPSLFASKNLLLIATFYLVLHALDDPARALRFHSLLSMVLACVAVLGIFQVGFCPKDPGWIPIASRFFKRCDRAHAFYSIYMTLAGVLSIGLLALLPRVLPGRGERALWVGPACVVQALALALTYVRGAWVGVAAGVVALAVIVREARWLVLGVLGAAVLALFLAVPGLRHRAASMIDPADPTAKERLLIWQSGLRMARDHPIMGVGPGGVSDEYPRYADPAALRARRGHLHNVALQILVERGPLALLAWLWLFAAFLLEGRRMLAALGRHQSRERALVVGCVVATIGFLVAGLFEYNFGDSEVVMIEYFVMALAYAAARPLRAPP
jgi:O-antigen ligase